MLKQNNGSWIKSRWYDSFFILLPPFLCLLIIYLFPSIFRSDTETAWFWFLLIVCIDVGHVYSTIYRTYMDKETLEKNRILFYLSPIVIYLLGVVLYSVTPLLFWRCMAYLAVFHFIRQQYGFMRLYARSEADSKLFRKIDEVMIYGATIYPLLYWHLQGPQRFNWFVENDFIYFNSPEIIPVLRFLYVALLFLYAAKEIYVLIRNQTFNLPKNILMLGTIISWCAGIIYFKGDLTFTLLNVVSHGIPYYALVWAYGNKRLVKQEQPASWMKIIFKPANVLIFLGFLFLLSYIEELLWDGFIWKEHLSVFPTSKFLPDLSDNQHSLSFLIPLLALPQLLHYFIDGFIWKVRKDKYGWSQLLFGKTSS